MVTAEQIELEIERKRRGPMGDPGGNGRERSRGSWARAYRNRGATWRPSMARAPWMSATPLFCEQRKGETGVGWPACLAGAS